VPGQSGDAHQQPEEGAKPRDRVLSNAELVAMWNGCQDDAYGRVVRLLILTGQRREEVGAMSWPELNRAAGTWTISASRAKNGREHTLALHHRPSNNLPACLC
jgi:integrase